MAAIKGRRQRVGVAGTTLMSARVHPEHLVKAKRAAEALGISLAAYVDELLAREELDALGRPLWWSDPIPPDQQELPLDKTA
jgi:hypothetical protein